MTFAQRVLEIADPRGRCNRKALLGIALTLLAIQAIALAVQHFSENAILHLATTVVELGCLWIATSAAIKRLHDLGRSGWWVPGFVVFLFVWMLVASFVSFMAYGEAVAQIGSPEFMVYATAAMLPSLAATIWLHFAIGDEGRNKYGAEPDETGLAPSSGIIQSAGMRHSQTA